jgi:soluble lytic murein transglycosylase-like protein
MSRRSHYWMIVLLSFLGNRVAAEVYSFVDEDGVVHYTNVPTDSRYRRVDSNGKPIKPKSSAKPKNNGFSATALGAAVSTKIGQYDEYISEASKRFNIPEALIRAVMVVESAGNPGAISSAGAQGLMQMMPGTANEMGVEDPFNPRQSILGGTRYLRTLANTFDGDLVLTLAAYNAGHQAVFRYMDIPPISETQQYVRRVLQLYFHYKQHTPKPAIEPSQEKKTP